MTLTIGEPFPAFRAPGLTNPIYVLDSAAGRYIVLAVLSEADDDQIGTAMALARAHRDRFDDLAFCFFALLPDRARWRDHLQDDLPGLRCLFDTHAIVRTLGVTAGEIVWFLIDPTMRVLAIATPDQADRLLTELAGLPEPALHSGVSSTAPVLVVPRVFEPRLCRMLIEHYNAVGGRPSGFMREIDGVTRLVNDLSHKRRSDVLIQDDALVQAARSRISRRLAPEIRKAFQYEATRIERYMVASYDETGGYFRPHRDNTTKGTAHRRFAVSINLNSDFEGGDLRFPEFGPRTFRPPPGGAVVFSCSLLHEATVVTRGQRFAFLPFLYDDAAAEIRARNLKYVDTGEMTGADIRTRELPPG